MLLDNVVQPDVLSLFSSTSSHPLLLASALTVPPTPSNESFIALLPDSCSPDCDGGETLLAWAGQDGGLEERVASLRAVRANAQAGEGETPLKDVRGRVLHLQAPDCRTTSVRWGWMPSSSSSWKEEGLGVELDRLHLQIKDMGQACYVDVAVLSEDGEVVVVRASTWQSAPNLHPATPSRPRLLHLPLLFPSSSSSSTPLLTRWTTLTLPLSTLFSSVPPSSSSTASHPPRFKAVLGVEVHATCRLRRVWFSSPGAGADGMGERGTGEAMDEVDEEMVRRGIRPELALFAAG
ncbi:hypothetical protein JCM8097_002447 [Rhodosporidiobolus ruineniae]